MVSAEAQWIEGARGVATYRKGDMTQGRYAIALSDLGNCFSDKAFAEGCDFLRWVGQINEVAVGDLIEMPLSVSFACKDAMLDWELLGIDPVEWPPQRLG